jgi:hypothetical protein
MPGSSVRVPPFPPVETITYRFTLDLGISGAVTLAVTEHRQFPSQRHHRVALIPIAGRLGADIGSAVEAELAVSFRTDPSGPSPSQPSPPVAQLDATTYRAALDEFILSSEACSSLKSFGPTTANDA